MDDDLLQEQREFYRARAPEYDDWWQRRGPYDRGEAETAEWRRQVAVVTDALASFDARGDVLELAGGTGWWTDQLARTADHLTVVDASPEALQINRQRGCAHRRWVCRRRHLRLAPRAVLRRGLLLVLALPRAPATHQRLLGPRAFVPRAR